MPKCFFSMSFEELILIPESSKFRIYARGLFSSTALGRIGKPNDIGGVIAFLCTDEASFIDGAIIPIDGGYHL